MTELKEAIQQVLDAGLRISLESYSQGWIIKIVHDAIYPYASIDLMAKDLSTLPSAIETGLDEWNRYVEQCKLRGYNPILVNPVTREWAKQPISQGTSGPPTAASRGVVQSQQPGGQHEAGVPDGDQGVRALE